MSAFLLDFRQSIDRYCTFHDNSDDHSGSGEKIQCRMPIEKGIGFLAETPILSQGYLLHQ